MTLSIYLTFDGNCREAFDHYKSIFGGDFVVIQIFGDGPPEMGAPDAAKDRIMHVSLPIGDSILMGSDSMTSEPLKMGDNFSISYKPVSKADADEKFARLRDGGAEIMPMQETFWNAYFGLCKDKFGISWMLNHEL